ncbi:hypothetical protein [Streptomyces sp. NPDC001070]
MPEPAHGWDGVLSSRRTLIGHPHIAHLLPVADYSLMTVPGPTAYYLDGESVTPETYRAALAQAQRAQGRL